jgi:hypothetical protein
VQIRLDSLKLYPNWCRKILFQADRIVLSQKNRRKKSRRKAQKGIRQHWDDQKPLQIRPGSGPRRVGPSRDVRRRATFPLGTCDNIIDICHFNRVTSRILPFWYRYGIVYHWIANAAYIASQRVGLCCPRWRDIICCYWRRSVWYKYTAMRSAGMGSGPPGTVPSGIKNTGLRRHKIKITGPY